MLSSRLKESIASSIETSLIFFLELDFIWIHFILFLYMRSNLLEVLGIDWKHLQFSRNKTTSCTKYSCKDKKKGRFWSKMKLSLNEGKFLYDIWSFYCLQNEPEIPFFRSTLNYLYHDFFSRKKSLQSFVGEKREFLKSFHFNNFPDLCWSEYLTRYQCPLLLKMCYYFLQGVLQGLLCL